MATKPIATSLHYLNSYCYNLKYSYIHFKNVEYIKIT